MNASANTRSYKRGAALFIRAFGFVSLVAFGSLALQVRGLVGSRGISPLAERMEIVRTRGLSLLDVPTLFRFADSDAAIFTLLTVGMLAALSLCIGRTPRAQRLAIALCWLIYLSFVNAGGSFFAYQWDALLLEASVVALFFSPRGGEQRVARALVTFLLFRLMFSSGVVKLSSGDPAWRDLSAMTYHYFTQPLPHVLGYHAHQLPAFVHTLSALGMFVIELVLPFALFVSGWPRRVAVSGTIALQVLITLTGNYGFFNLLAIALCLPLLDDALLRCEAKTEEGRLDGKVSRASLGCAMVYVLASLLSFLPTLGGPTIGSARFALAPFHSTNAYGLFAVMTRDRPEIVFEGRFGDEWIEYALPVKPVALDRAPRFAFFHLPRLDWGLWFAALGSGSHGRMVPRVADALRRAEPAVLGLFSDAPRERPDDVRVRYYDYRFTEPGDDSWWSREEQF